MQEELHGQVVKLPQYVVAVLHFAQSIGVVVTILRV